MERNLRELSASVSFTPGRRDFEPLCALLGGEGETDELKLSVGEDRMVWFAAKPRAAAVVLAAERCARRA